MSCEGYALRPSNLISTRTRFKKRLDELTAQNSQPHRLPLNFGRQVFTTRGQGRGRKTDGMVVYSARGKGGGAYQRILVTEVAQQMRIFLESEEGVAAQAANSLVKSIDPQGRAALLSALFATCTCFCCSVWPGWSFLVLLNSKSLTLALKWRLLSSLPMSFLCL